MSFKGKLYFIGLTLIFLSFSVLLAVVLNGNMPITEGSGNILYITTKIIVSLILIICVGYCVYFHNDRGNQIIQLSLTILLQFLPLLIRFILTAEEPSFALAIILSFVITIIYLGIVLSLDILSAQINKTAVLLEGKKIAIVSDEDYNDEDGHFSGAKNRKKENK